jgi:phosphate starvation-inducible PhoH-like protein
LILQHTIESADNRRLANLCGPLDSHLREIEGALDVTITRRGAHFSVEGARAAATRAIDLLESLHGRAERPIAPESLQLTLTEARANLHGLPALAPAPPTPTAPAPAPAPALEGAPAASSLASSLDAGADALPSVKRGEGGASRSRAGTQPASAPGSTSALTAVPTSIPAPIPAPELQSDAPVSEIVLHTRRADLRGRTPNQVRYLQQMLASDITFGIGPAGTGKTFLAVACAVDALERQSVQRIVLTRPAVEAGERLGFLPGDLAQKVDPYLRPLYDALYDLMGFERVTRAFERGQLEIAPLAFMRGRTLNHAFVILDEAQNTTREQMKMFLTRIGFGTRCVVTGDVSQIDLPSAQPSGLVDAARVLGGVKGITFTHFSAADVVRHPLVARIVEAYDADRRAGA